SPPTTVRAKSGLPRPTPFHPGPLVAHPTPMDQAVRTQIAGAIAKNRVILFMKGTRSAPSCGLSGRVVNLLDTRLDTYPTLGVPKVTPDPPEVTLTERAAEAIRGFLGDEADVLLIDIDGTFSPTLSIGVAGPKATVSESRGIRLSVEPRAWKRAQGITIDY